MTSLEIPDLMRPIADRVEDALEGTRGAVVLRWGTVTQVGPLRVRLDADGDPIPFTPASAPTGLQVGDRVRCSVQNLRVTVESAVRGPATQAQVDQGTDTQGYVTPKTLHDTLGRAGFDVPVTLDRSKSFMSYTERQHNPTFESRIKATVLPGGPVVLSGLLWVEGTPAAGTIIGTIPAEYAPEFVAVCPALWGDAARCLYVHPDGTLRTGVAPLSNTYFSLDGIAYIRKGFGNWVAPTSMGTAFTEINASTYGHVSMHKDEYGFVWWRGCVRNTVGVADNAVIANISADHGCPDNGGSASEFHLRAVSNDGLGVVGVAKSTLKIKANTSGMGTANGAILHLGGIVTYTQTALDLNIRTTLVWTQNSWLNYGAPYPPAGILRRPDGIVGTTGLIRSGSVGYPLTIVPDLKSSPQEGAKILATVSDGGYARLDMSGVLVPDSSRARRIYPQQGSNGWYSLDGNIWIP